MQIYFAHPGPSSAENPFPMAQEPIGTVLEIKIEQLTDKEAKT
jgi:hypothetical protein